MFFCERLNFVLDLFQDTGRSLARVLHVDPSLVNRWQNGHRLPSPKSRYIEDIVNYYGDKDLMDFQLQRLTETIRISLPNCNLETSVKLKKALAEWLLMPEQPAPEKESTPEAQQSSQSAVLDRLTGLKNLPQVMIQEAPRPLAVSGYDPPVGKAFKHELYTGNEGKRQAMMKIFHTALASRQPVELLLTGQDDMTWLVEDAAYLSQNLARIRTDLPVTLDLEQAKPDRFDPLAVEKLFHELEFRTLTQRLKKLNQRLKPTLNPQAEQGNLFGSEPAAADPEPTKPLDTEFETVIVDSPEKLKTCVTDLKKAPMIAFDTETTGVNPLQDQLVGISLAGSPEKGYYIPLGHDKGQQLPIEAALSALKPLLTDPKIGKVAHNAKYDLLVLRQVGIEVSPITFDTMIAEWLITPNSRHLGLKALAWVRLGVEMTLIEALIGKGKNQITMAQVPIAKAAPYAAADAVMTLRLVPFLEADLQDHGVEKLNQDIEVKLIPILADMEEAGILLDLPLFDQFSHELGQEIHKLEQAIYQQAGEEFNINSTQKLSDVLFKKLALDPPDVTKKTSSGKFSTAAGVLEEMKGIHPIIDLVLNYRELTKLQSTYVEALPQQVNPNTGRVHTTFNQTGTVTGRIASQNPNLQNIPTRTELGRKVRQGFIAAPGKKLLAVDYSRSNCGLWRTSPRIRP